MAPLLEGKSIGSYQKVMLKGELLILRTKNQARGEGVVQLSPNWFLGNWTLDTRLKWA
jgi:hypothetical protein